MVGWVPQRQPLRWKFCPLSPHIVRDVNGLGSVKVPDYDDPASKALPYAPWSKDDTHVDVHPCHIGNSLQRVYNSLETSINAIFIYIRNLYKPLITTLFHDHLPISQNLPISWGRMNLPDMTMARRGRGRSTSTGFDGRRAQERSQGPGRGDHHPYWTWMMGNFTGEIPKKSLLITMVSCSRVSTKNPSTFKKPKGDVATEKHELSMLQSGQYPKVEKNSSLVQGAESWK